MVSHQLYHFLQIDWLIFLGGPPLIEGARISVTHYLIQQGWQKDLAQPPLHQFNSSGLPSRLAANTSIISIDQACPIELGSQQFHQLIQRAGLLGIGSAASIINLTGLAFGVWQPMHSSLYFFFCSGGFYTPKAIHFLCSSQVSGPKTSLIISSLFTAGEAYS